MKLALGLVIGLAVGLVGGALIARNRKPAEAAPPPSAAAPMPAPPSAAPPPPPDPEPEMVKLRAEVADLKAKLEKAAKPAEPKSEEFNASGLAGRFAALASKGLKAFADPDYAAMLGELFKNKAKSVEYLSDLLLNSKSQDERFLAAAMLEGLKDPAGIPALSEALGKDEAGLVRRMASHALAMIGTEASLPALRAAMAADNDWGVRVNSAYGVAKLGQPDGAKALEDAYFSKDAAGYQGIILQALADAATSANAPFFRRVLGEANEIGALIASIGALEKLKDSESLSLLNRVAGDAKYDPTVREAARKAAEALSK